MLSSRASAPCGSFMKKTPSGFERTVDVREHRRRVDLVVHCVEHEDEIERSCERRAVRRRTTSNVTLVELRARRLRSCPSDRAVVEVVADERRRGECPRQHHEGVAGAARDVGHADARLEPVTQARGPAADRDRRGSRRTNTRLMPSITSVNSGRYSEYGTPPPSRNAARLGARACRGGCRARPSGARFIGPSVSIAACAAAACR